ncbi:MAG: hypothetical protein ACOX6N_01405 [Patescibacteria group bacterium]|jgi:hypothetical protein
MPEFKRSRLERKAEEQITRKTVFLGFATLLSVVLVIVFGLPFLVRFSIFLGETKSKNDTEEVEGIPPLAPRIVLPFEATNSARIAVVGTAEANTEVELLKNDVSLGKEEVSAEGDFSFSNIELDSGENHFSAIAIADDGLSSDISAPSVIVFDNESPTIEMTHPIEDSVTVESAEYEVAGKSEKDVSVLVNGRVALVDNEGQFKTILQLNPGKNDIEVTVRDLAGNEAKKKIEVTYDI